MFKTFRSGRPGDLRLEQRLGRVAAVAILGSLAACGGLPPGPAPDAAPLPDATATPPRPAETALPPAEAVRLTGRGRWTRAQWEDLPGWVDDPVHQAWPALLRSCERHDAVTASALLAGTATTAASPAPAGPSATASSAGTLTPFQVAAAWAPTCQAARQLGRDAPETALRLFFHQRLQPWRVEAADGRPDGLLTGYFEPLIEASRRRTDRFSVPLHLPPAELGQRKPWYTRAQIDSLPAAQAALKGREIAWVADPMDALLVQIQGSGRLVFTEPGGQRRTVRLAYAGHNDQPYLSVGRWLVDQGAFTLEQASWPAIRAWSRANPQRIREMLNVNPRYVFFREEALPDPSIGATGAQGVALTPGRSIAVDRESIPYGTPVWLASTEPQPWSLNPPPARPLQRLVVAQDTGSAITGAVRADYFWGWGEGIEERAGRTKQPLRLWALWPKGA